VSKAPAFDQQRLLDVQALDTRLQQLAHRRRSLPEHARLQALDGEQAARTNRQIEADTLVSDLQREVRKAEADVEQVRSRAQRDQARLDAGTGSARDLQAIQHELTSLARRQGELEDVELEVMERLEQAQTRSSTVRAELEAGSAEATELTSARDAAAAAIDSEAVGVTTERDEIAAGLDPGLVALYDKVRAASGGLGAAALRARRCEGCRLQLTPVDLARIKAAPVDEIVRCDECRRILVRVAESQS